MAKKKEKPFHLPKCPHLGKISYSSRKEAAKKAKSTAHLFEQNMGYYKCSVCNYYHLFTKRDA